MEATTATRLHDARAALAAGEWGAARDGFQGVLDADPDCPEAHAGLADAAWWLGDTQAAIRGNERAYALFRRRPDPMQAALRAVPLYLHHRVSLGHTAVARGWLARLARLVEDFELVGMSGWVALLRAHDAQDPVVAARWAREALAAPIKLAASDLELCALSQLGAALVQQGEVDEGTALLDEAMVGALAGEGEQRETVVFSSCNLISACWAVADLDRLVQWIRAADSFSDSQGAPHLYTHCRVHHGAALFQAGRWSEAERELVAAQRSGRSGDPALVGEALGWLARLRLAQGRWEEAARLLEGFEDHAACVLPTAALQLAAGDADTALRLARDRVHELDAGEELRRSAHHCGAAVLLEHGELLELLVSASLAAGRPAEAKASADQLTVRAAETGLAALQARADRAHGRVHRAAVEGVEAARLLEQAVDGFTRLGLRLEAATTRLELAELVAPADAGRAAAEARTALAALDDLGAAAADRAAGLLRELGRPGSRPRGPRGDPLTPREQEVLRLLGEGLSNRELAQRLYLSRKTVEHHVHSVLTKLDLRSRAEAAAYAVRHDAPG